MRKVEFGGHLGQSNCESPSLKSLLIGGKVQQNLSSGQEEKKLQAAQGISK